MQVSFEHICLAGQHVAPQAGWPFWHAHTPCVHVWPDVHTLPQAPQFDESLLVSVHTPLQQLPLEHSALFAQLSPFFLRTVVGHA
jgi:hypothetical protein